MDEFRTSKLGCCCNVRVTHPKKRRYGPATNDNTRNGVSICTRCDKTWNRDVSAAINMHRLFLNVVQGEDRPAVFTRGHQLPE